MNIRVSKFNIVLIVLLLLLSIPSILPLFSSGFFTVHDDTQVARVFEMKNALEDGMFPVRWVEHLGYGYGYPIFNFYAPLAYYIGGFINLLGFDSLIATKIMMGLGTLLAVVSMYLLAREFWGKTGGIISGLLYLYAPYHALNLYVRGAIAELWAYGILPILFLSIYKIFTSLKDKKNVWSWVYITAISYAAIILSHNLTAMMITPFVLLFGAILFFSGRKQKVEKTHFIPLALLLGVMLSAFYWLPVSSEMKYTNVLSVVGGGSDYHDHFVCPEQLWFSNWGYGGSGPGCTDGMSFKLGKVHIILALLSLVPLFFYRKKNYIVPIGLGFSGLLVSLFLMLQYSQFIWDLIPQMSFFQFPWRFLLLASFFLSFLGGAFLFLIPKVPVAALGGIVALLIIVANVDSFVPGDNLPRTASSYTNLSEIKWTTSKISDEYMPMGFQKPLSSYDVPKEKIVIDQRVGKVIEQSVKTQEIEATVDLKKKANIKLQIAYYPAWHVYIDGKEVNYKNTSTGLRLAVPEGKHTIRAAFHETPIEQAGNIVSLTGVILLIAGIITQRKDNKKSAKGS